MSWSNICIEGFCFGKLDKRGNYPCGLKVPTHLCLVNGQCPHFAWGETSEREVALFVPLYLIIGSKVKSWISENVYWKLRWWTWDSLWFNRQKTRKFLESIPMATSKDSPVLRKFEDRSKKAAKQFPQWFKQAKRESWRLHKR